MGRFNEVTEIYYLQSNCWDGNRCVSPPNMRKLCSMTSKSSPVASYVVATDAGCYVSIYENALGIMQRIIYCTMYTSVCIVIFILFSSSVTKICKHCVCTFE